MSARPLLALFAALAFCGAPAVAAAQPPVPARTLSAPDQALVDRAARYLDGLTRLRGQFEQTDARGRTTRGELYLDRPGKARFDYAAPSHLVVVSDGHEVGIFDSRMKTADRYPLRQTPLNLFLQKHVSLEREVVVTGVSRSPGGFSITMVDPTKKALGQITLTFSDNPIALRQWSIVDAQGGHTTVRLSNLTAVPRLDEKLFALPEVGPTSIR